MRDTQDVFFDRRYFQPAKQWADTCGFTRALSMVVIYDSFIHSGRILDFLRSRFPEPIPARGGNEQMWIKQYVDVRHNWLLNNDNPALHPTVYRTRDLAREITRGNWDLAMLPILAHGVPVDARPITAHMASTAEIPVGVLYFPDGSSLSQSNEGIQAFGEILVDNPFASAADVADDSDPAAPGRGEADDSARQRDLANFGEDGNLDLSPLPGVAAGASPVLLLDMSRARAFLQACMSSTPRVTYGLGAKVPFFGAVPGHDFRRIDCSGFVREAIRRATTPPLAFPDGSVNQHDWIRGHGFAKSSVEAAKQSDGLLRIAFLRPQDSAQHIGHVVLTSGARTLESHGGVGPDSRRWDGSGWQAKAFVYVLGREAAVVTAGGAPSFAAGVAAAGAEGRSFTVRHGRHYRATLALSWLEQLIGNANTIIEDKLKQAGFRDVVVTGSGATRYAHGTWNGADTTAPLDPHIINVVELATAPMNLGQLV